MSLESVCKLHIKFLILTCCVEELLAECYDLTPFCICRLYEWLRIDPSIHELLGFILMQSLILFAVFPSPILSVLARGDVDTVPMLLIVEPCSANWAAICAIVDSIAVFLIIMPRPSELASISPLHHSKPCHRVIDEITCVLLVGSGPVEFTESVYLSFLPDARVDCTIAPFDLTEPIVDSSLEHSLVEVSLLVFLFPETTFTIPFKVTNVLSVVFRVYEPPLTICSTEWPLTFV